MKKSPTHVSSWREEAARLVARPFFALLTLLARTLPHERLSRIASTISRAVFILFPGVREGLLANAEKILGPQSTPSQRAFLSRGVLESFARFLTELVTPAGRGPRQDLHRDTWGREHFELAAARGRGVIAVTLHMGNYELSSMELASLRPNVTIVYNRERIAFLERLRSRRRSEKKLQELLIDDSMFFAIEARERLREGGVVLLSGDQVAARDGERAPFLHGVAPFSLWPARLAIASGAPILPAFNVRTAKEGYQLRIEPPIFASSTDDPARLMGELIKVFERYVRDYPEQWLMIRPFWVV